MGIKTAFALSALLLFSMAQPAAAAESTPGSACSTANRWQWAGGPENGGVVNGMFCNGSMWGGIINFQSSGKVGIATASPAAKLDVNGTIRFAYGGEACDAAHLGALYFSSATHQMYGCLTAPSWTQIATGTGGATPAGSNGQIQFNSNGTAFGANGNFFWDNANKRLGVGTATPQKDVEISAADSSTELRVVNRSSTATRGPKISIRNYTGGNGGYPYIAMFNSRGNSTTTAAIQNNDRLGAFEYDGTYDTGGSYSTAADVIGEAEANFTSTSTPGRLILRTTASGSTNPTERMRIDSTGNVGIGTATPAANLLVNGGGVGQNIFEVDYQNSAQMAINQWGQISFGRAISVVPNPAVGTMETLFYGRGASGQAANLLELDNSVSAPLFVVSSSGAVGIGTPTPGTSFDNAGSTALSGDITPAQITANQNNYNPANLATASVLRLSSNASRNITSLAGGADGRILTIMNVGSNPIVLKNDDGATGTAANRFALTGDLTLAASQSAILMYDSTASRWRQIANGTATGAAAAAGGSNREVQYNNAGVLGSIPSFAYNTDGSVSLWKNDTATATGNYFQANFMMNVAPSATQSSGRVAAPLSGQAFIPNTNAQQIRKVVGANAYAENQGTGAVEQLLGALNYAWNNGSSVNGMFGLYTAAETAAGAITNLWGSDVETKITGGTVTNAYALMVANSQTGGTVTNRYGIYINPPTGTATNDWGLYQGGTEKNRFNGAVGINATPGTEKLRVWTTTGNGLYGGTSDTAGMGILGEATAATGTTYGVYGRSSSTGNGASGVFGYASATTGSTNGVFGEADSSTGWGVYGNATSTSGSGYGVRGETQSTGGIGVSGYAYATTGFAYGVSGWSDSTSGRGLYGRATAASGTTYGVYGMSDSTAGYGVYCNATWASGCGGNKAWTNASDARLKDHIEDLKPESGLAAIMRLRPVRYQWKDAATAKKPELGFLAQDVEKVLPELVGTGPDQTITAPDGKKQVIDHALTMSYGQMVVPLVKAVQELKAENDNLRTRLEKLEAERAVQGTSTGKRFDRTPN